jgi:hypothetical protein
VPDPVPDPKVQIKNPRVLVENKSTITYMNKYEENIFPLCYYPRPFLQTNLIHKDFKQVLSKNIELN